MKRVSASSMLTSYNQDVKDMIEEVLMYAKKGDWRGCIFPFISDDIKTEGATPYDVAPSDE